METERLAVRPWRPEETDALAAVYGHSEMYRYMPGTAPGTPEQVAAMMGRIQARYAAMPGMGLFAAVDRERDVPIGSALICPLEAGPEVEIGYHVAMPEWRKGYATEIARAMVRYGFEHLAQDALYGVVVPDNTGSRKALERAGLREIDRGSYYGLDALLLRITRAEYDVAPFSPA